MLLCLSEYFEFIFFFNGNNDNIRVLCKCRCSSAQQRPYHSDRRVCEQLVHAGAMLIPMLFLVFLVSNDTRELFSWFRTLVCSTRRYFRRCNWSGNSLTRRYVSNTGRCNLRNWGSCACDRGLGNWRCTSSRICSRASSRRNNRRQASGLQIRPCYRSR